jgi:hypothetical protein
LKEYYGCHDIRVGGTKVAAAVIAVLVVIWTATAPVTAVPTGEDNRLSNEVDLSATGDQASLPAVTTLTENNGSPNDEIDTESSGGTPRSKSPSKKDGSLNVSENTTVGLVGLENGSVRIIIGNRSFGPCLDA